MKVLFKSQYFHAKLVHCPSVRSLSFQEQKQESAEIELRSTGTEAGKCRNRI